MNNNKPDEDIAAQTPSLRNDALDSTQSNYIQRATTDNTRTAYRSDIRHFQQWGGRLPTDTTTVIRYCEAHAKSLNPRTLKRRLVAIKQFHRYQGFSDPTDHPLVEKTMKGIFKTHGSPKAQAPALMLDELRLILDHIDTVPTLSARRNAALLSLGFFCALRGRELINVQHSQMAFEPQGLTLTIPRSKTDPEGQGQSCAIPVLENTYCPVAAVKRWLDISGIDEGYLFPSINRWGHCSAKPITIQGLNLLLRNWANAVGLANANQISSHSLRRGLATSASAAGASFKSIMQQGRWRHEGTVLEYIEAGQRFDDNAVNKLFE